MIMVMSMSMSMSLCFFLFFFLLYLKMSGCDDDEYTVDYATYLDYIYNPPPPTGPALLTYLPKGQLGQLIAIHIYSTLLQRSFYESRRRVPTYVLR
ncbi:hypothetical protein DFH27DRAFT_569763 [Peziza echinospora]|nr:hypothetical protein DFH27DRAFT_569763 [Peziza echinospora]